VVNLASEVKCKSGNYTYLYESTSFRNEDGNPRNKRKIIGRIDPETGAKVYKPEYIKRMLTKGTPITIEGSIPIYSADAIKNSSVKEFGLTFLLRTLAERSGLTAALTAASPRYCKQIYAIASHLVACGDPFMYCQEWLAEADNIDDAGDLSAKKISRILGDLSFGEREAFFQEWCKRRLESEYLALDITSVSSYSELIDDVEWGYNRDHEDLAQINLCMLMGETSRLPIYQAVYSGSLKDVSTLKTTMAKFDAISGSKQVLVVMDKGFCKIKNINALLSEDKKFIIALSFSLSFTQNQVKSERKDIDSLKNAIVVGGDSLRAVTKIRAWNPKHKVFTHIFFNPVKAASVREKLCAKVAEMRKQALLDPGKFAEDAEYRKYLIIRKSEQSGYTVTVREDVVENEYKHSGWLVIISNHVENAEETLRIYRAKDVVEKGFMKLKNSLDLGRLRVHGDDAMQNKIFIGFIALILLSNIHNTMLDAGLYKKYTMKQLMRILSKHRVQEINGTRIQFASTKQQNDIYSAFDIQVAQ
jgi:transposase